MARVELRFRVRVAWWVSAVAIPAAKLSARCGVYPHWIERLVIAHGIKAVVV